MSIDLDCAFFVYNSFSLFTCSQVPLTELVQDSDMIITHVCWGIWTLI